MTSPVVPGTLRPVIRLIGSRPSAGDVTREEELLAWDSETWGQVLLHLPVEASAFRGEVEYSWESVTGQLDAWCQEFRTRPDTYRQRYLPLFGYLGLLLVTLVSLRHSYLYRYTRGRAEPGAPTHDCAALCEPMLREPAVRDAIRALYAPAAPADDARAREEWDGIDFGSLRFHRHGTTSFILAGRSANAVQGHRRPLALKCILHPYLRVPAIVRATRSHLARYAVDDVELRHLAHVWASSGRWILMDFVPGETLAEYLQRQPERDGIRVDLLTDLGPKLFRAMIDLERVGLRHGDLSPSNIIVHRNAAGELSLVLVDLGINHLYSHAVPGSDGPDVAYVPPEIRTGGAESDRSDVFSVGQLLIAVAGAPGRPPERSALVPDACYAESTVLARFLEDLTDADPAHRLLIFRPDPALPRYPQLLTFFEEELAAVTAAREERQEGLRGLLAPLSGAPGRARRMWAIRREQSLYRDPRRGMYVRWLMFWSWLSAVAWWGAATVVGYWWLRDIGWDWGNQPITVLQRITGSSEEEFPGLDALRADDYPIPDLVDSLPVRMVGLSFLVVGARFYQNVLAGLTPLATGPRQGRLSVLALLAEANMRLFAVLAAVLTLPPTLVQRDWWPIFTAVGVFLVFLCNLCCLSFARAAVRRARGAGLSTVPAGRITGLQEIGYWTASAGFYSFAVWSIGSLIYLGHVHDVHVYAGAVTAINIVIFYIRNCSGPTAADVRTALARACLAAERLRHLPGPR